MVVLEGLRQVISGLFVNVEMVGMNLDDLEIFCDVAVHGSFSKAAAIHDLAQPTITQKIQAIEKHLGVVLLQRKRPLLLTPAGQVFFEGIRKLLDDYRAVEDSVLQFRDRVVGHVQVAAIYSIGLLKMEECLKEFNERYPDAKADIHYQHPHQVVEQVLNGGAHLGLLSFPDEKRELAVVPWQEQPLVLVVNPRHKLAVEQTISIQRLEGEAFVAFTNELTIRKRIDKWLREQHVAVNVVQEFDNIGQIKEGIGDGTGVAILPSPTVRREVEAGLLCAIPFSDVHWSRPLGIIHRRQKSLPTAVQKFIELLTGTGSAATAAAVLMANRAVATASQNVVQDANSPDLTGSSGPKRIAKQV